MAIEIALQLSNMARMHQALLGNKRFVGKTGSYAPDNGYMSGSGGYGGDMIAPPWVEPPQSFLSFDELGKVALPVVAAPDATIVSLLVPDGYDGVIKTLSLNFVGGGFVQGSGDIIWRLLADGQAIRNYSNITSEKGSPEQPRAISGGIRIFSGQLITAVVNHTADVTLAGDVMASIGGWFYPSKGQ
jgi:hypothetical protein